MAMVTTKVPVSWRALVQRIDRKLAQQEQALKKARSAAMREELGPYYIVSWRFNRVEVTNVDPVALAKELGLLREWEEVREEE
jgi:hypothetical protein